MTELWMFLRGQRIQDQLDEAARLDEVSTQQQLVTNIERVWPQTRKRQNATNEVNITKLEYIPYIGTKLLHVRSQSVSNGHPYQQALQFVNVAFEDADTPENATFKATDGTDAHVQPIVLSNTNCKCRCNCMDFYYRFAAYNAQDRSLVGRAPKPYIRKTETRPSVNPDQVPGMCKHLLKLTETLRQNGLVK